MGAFAAGGVVLVLFPFSDLSQSKLRPAVVLAGEGHGDFVLCQVTSNAYADPRALELTSANFSRGSLQRTGFVRSGKLFTASDTLIAREVGVLTSATHARVVAAVVTMHQGATENSRIAQIVR